MRCVTLAEGIRRVTGGYIVVARAGSSWQFEERICPTFADVVQALWECEINTTAADEKVVLDACEILRQLKGAWP